MTFKQEEVVATPEVSAKNTKNEILGAYQSLLHQVREARPVSPVEIQKEKEEGVIVNKASGLTIELIVNNLADVKLSITRWIDLLEQKLIEERRRLNDVQGALKIEQANLEELYDIKKNTDSLAVLMLAHKEQKRKFEEEMIAKRLIFTQEQERIEQEHEVRISNLNKDRVREREEYSYNLHLERKKDSDVYVAKKEALDREFQEKKLSFQKDFEGREAAIVAKEEELALLKKRVEEFPKELDKTVKDAERAVKDTIERTYQHRIELSEREINGERQLNLQMISTLQAKIKEQEDFISQLNKKTSEAGNQAQAIALKAIESSGMRYYGGMHDDSKKLSQQST